MDVGPTIAEVSPVTGRMSYRGKVMNRAARISSTTASGQVYCSAAVWQECESKAEVLRADISASSLGLQKLKGVVQPVELLVCRCGGFTGNGGPRTVTCPCKEARLFGLSTFWCG